MPLHVLHILVQYEHEAQDLLRRIQAGEDFGELAKKHSSCPSRARGGDLGPIEPRRLVEEFAGAAQELKPGEISSPVRTRFGYHLIKKV